jgi:hypothetical protein
MPDIGFVEISQERFDELLKCEMWCEAMSSAGVDNWDGYSYAYELFEEMLE